MSGFATLRSVLEFAFVTAPGQNHFFLELVAAVRDELEQAGVASSIHVGDFPPVRDGLIYVLVPPHEWFALHGYRAPPSHDQLRRTILLCTEQPDTSYFVDNALLAPYAGAVFDINPGSIAEFARRGVDGVHHFQLGWTRTWSSIARTDLDEPAATAGRDIDVLHLGVSSARRARLLGATEPYLSRRQTHFVVAHPDTPNDARRTSFATDAHKLALLRRAKVLLNIHQGEHPYFEWLRVVQAIAQGCTVVSEHSLHLLPLQANEHLLVGSAESLGLLAAGLLDDEPERARMARTAYQLLLDELPLSRAVAEMVAAGRAIAAQTPQRSTAPLPGLCAPVGSSLDLDFRGPDPGDDEARASAPVRRALKDLQLEMLDLRRSLRRSELESALGHTVPAVALDATTAARRLQAPPMVTVITPLYNHADHVRAALDSALASSFESLELVVVDDGSTDDSLAVVRQLMAERPDRAITLLRHPVNRGLAATRNAALAAARGELIFVLDADNLVSRHGIERLVDALDESPEATAAYGILERFTREGTTGLVSAFPWEPRRLRNGNYIDAMALWRAAPLRELGGYSTDRRLYGWEDYDLWCRLAETGGVAAFVPQIVARYRATSHSMIATTDLSVLTAFSVIAERHPLLFEGVRLPF